MWFKQKMNLNWKTHSYYRLRNTKRRAWKPIYNEDIDWLESDVPGIYLFQTYDNQSLLMPEEDSRVLSFHPGTIVQLGNSENIMASLQWHFYNDPFFKHFSDMDFYWTEEKNPEKREKILDLLEKYLIHPQLEPKEINFPFQNPYFITEDTRFFLPYSEEYRDFLKEVQERSKNRISIEFSIPISIHEK